MKVKDLIKELQKHPGDYEVILADRDYAYLSLSSDFEVKDLVQIDDMEWEKAPKDGSSSSPVVRCLVI